MNKEDIMIKEKDISSNQDQFKREFLKKIEALQLANKQLKKEIEERTRAEAELQHIYDNSPVMMISVDSNGVILNANQQWLKTTGYKRDEVKNRNINIFMPSKLCRKLLIDLFHIKRRHKLQEIHSKLVRKDGAVIDVLAEYKISQSPCGKQAALLLLREKTEQCRTRNKMWEAKRMLRTVVDGISDPLVMVDKHLIIKMLNESALKYYRLCDYQEAIGQPCYDVLKREAALCRRCSVPAALSGSTQVMFERKGLFDAERIEQVSVYPVQEVTEGVSGGIIRISDITEKKRIDEQLIRADRLTSLGQLSGGIAHEIRNPLSGIRLFVDILSDIDRYPRSPQEIEIFEDIKLNIHKINGIIRRVLDFAGHDDPISDEIDLNHLIQDTLLLWRARMRKSNIRLDLRLAEDLPMISGDGIALQQVLTNLVQNAIDAMGEAGTLSIHTQKGISEYHRGRPAVLLDVCDTGPGIDEEAHKRIFDPFFTTKPKGVGLGLSISNQIVDRHGGILSSDTHPDTGTRFRVELPIKEEN